MFPFLQPNVFRLPKSQTIGELEITGARFDELLSELIKAWWRGDLVASGAERADVLRAVYNFS